MVCTHMNKFGNRSDCLSDLGSSGESVSVMETKTYSGSFSGVPTKISVNTVSVERGMSWISAVNVAMEHSADDDGFYLSKLVDHHLISGPLTLQLCSG